MVSLNLSNKCPRQSPFSKIFNQKRFHKKLFQSQGEKNSGVLRLNQIKSKLLTIKKCLQLNCCLQLLHCFEHAEQFHFSHITWGIINVLTGYIKFRYVYVNFKRTNQSCSPSKSRQSVNGERRTCDRNGNNSFSESEKNVCRLMKRGTF